MTIIVAYAPRPEGRAALDKGIELARRFQEHLVVVNAGPGGTATDPSLADSADAEDIEKMLASSGIDSEFKQFVRGKSAVEEIEEMVERLQASLVIIGLRRRSPVGKLFLGSTAQDLLLKVDCPVLAVKAG
ncbi:universal stress protein [Aromatoleum evansii]|uniref:Universal stress protein n=1 Tax=Aromatoleum evansii TaxID=59406 RepID=A0ABZ1AFM8_AROEV|nr:universal stress protein [Aromatoleum evansii]NMG28180.1 universal stress protein [Aromatoleum evansii]WRL44680.1 universal stress protein [Aromatoleum evansii]